MPDVLIHRCSIRVVRRGGWSWGPHPRELLDALLQALPGLIEAELAESAGTPGDDRVFTAPVRITVRVPAATNGVAAAGAPPPVAERLVAAIEQRVRAVAPPGEPAPGEIARRDGAGPRALAATATPRSGSPAVTASEALAALAHGDLPRLVALLPPAALAEWTRWAASPSALPREADAAVRRALAEAAALSAATSVRPSAVAADALGEAESSLAPPPAVPLPSGPATAPQVRVADVAPERAPSGSSRSAPLEAATGGSPQAHARAPGPHVVPAAERTAPRGAVDVAALPFLATAVLARLGYLDAVAAALAAEALPLPAFAQALTAKLLDPPAHGWRRSSRDDDTVAAVAGLAAPLPGEAMLTLARGARSFSAGIDGVVAALLLEGRARDVPMIVLQSAHGELAAIDPTGLFLVALGPAALDAVAAAGAPARAADPEVRRALAAAGLRLSGRLRADDRERAEEILAAFAARPAVPPAPDPALERSLTLAAALALGTIAWRLWPDEDPDPLLALQRFGDLDARATLEADRVVVRLPLGRRHRDLEAGGFLGEVRLSWLDGRRLELTCG